MDGKGQPAGIVGLGAVTGYGWGFDTMWQAMVAGRSAVRPSAALADALGEEAVWVAEVPDGGDPADGSLFARAMLASVREAVADARARGWEPGEVVGVVHCAVLGDIRELRDFYLADGTVRPRHQYLRLMPSTPLSMLMQSYRFHGPCMVTSSMCASGNTALLTAKAWLDTGVATDVIVAATDLSVTPEHVKHFRDLGVLVTDTDAFDASRPFQQGSRGFAGGEAAVAAVVTRRPGRRYASVAGGALSHDAYHVAHLDPAGTQVRRSVVDALAAAGVAGDEVGYLCAHGPGTAQCDTVEAAVRDELLPNAALWSAKPLVGHCQGAAALVEVAVAAAAYERGVVPAPAPVAPGHPALLAGPTPTRPAPTVKTSIGLGGHNSAVVLVPDPA